MKITKSNLWQLINTVLIITLLSYIAVTAMQKEEVKSKIVYIDNIKIFNGFNMTKDLSKENEKKYAGKIKVFDSLVNKIKAVEINLQKLRTIPENKKIEYAKLQKIVVEKDKELKEIQTFVKNDLNKKIWKRLNDYIKIYGEKHHIDIILGAQGNGNIMYGKANVDITNTFIKFANNKYEGN